MRHDHRVIGDDLQQFVGHPVGVRCQEAQALQAIHLCHDLQQLCQVGTVGDILAVAVDDLAQQGDLFDAL